LDGRPAAAAVAHQRHDVTPRGVGVDVHRDGAGPAGEVGRGRDERNTLRGGDQGGDNGVVAAVVHDVGREAGLPAQRRHKPAEIASRLAGDPALTSQFRDLYDTGSVRQAVPSRQREPHGIPRQRLGVHPGLDGQRCGVVRRDNGKIQLP